jgi:hypothetical protein
VHRDVLRSLINSSASRTANAAAFAAACGCQVPSPLVVLVPSALSLMPRTMATGEPFRWPACATPAASISIASASL